MKKFYAIAMAAVVSTGAIAQCNPSPIFVALGVPGIYPLPTDDLPSGSLGLPYEGNGLTISVLASDQGIDPAMLPIQLPITIPPGNSVVLSGITVQDVTGLPAGMTFQCNSPGCDATVAEPGCILISGTPTETGDFTVTLSSSFSGELQSILGNFPFNNTPPAPVQYNMRINDDASIAEFSLVGMGLFPNPASGEFTLSYPATEKETARIEIVDLNGKVVLAETKSVQTQGGNLSMNISNLANGLYRVVFTCGTVRTASKLVVRN